MRAKTSGSGRALRAGKNARNQTVNRSRHIGRVAPNAGEMRSIGRKPGAPGVMAVSMSTRGMAYFLVAVFAARVVHEDQSRSF